MSNKQALIVDDSRLAQFVLKKMLVAQDMEVSTSESAEEALKYLDQNKPDIIFLDHSMPGMNGLEALKAIKNNPNTAAIPVLMYTSQEDKNYLHKAQELGAVDVLPKQLRDNELKQALRKLEQLLAPDAIAESDADAANDDLSQRLPAISNQADKDELTELVRAAEVALAKETSHQQLKIRVAKIQKKISEAFPTIEEKLDRILPASEYQNNRRFFWNNLLWCAIYTVTVLFFGFAYFHQQEEINLLATATATANTIKQQNENIQLTTNTNNTAASTEPETTATPEPPATTNPDQPSIDLESLEALANSNNQIPYGEQLLGETVESTLNELLPLLEEQGFTGQVLILAHDATFCLATGSNGEFELATDTSPVTSCEINEPSARLADITSIDLLQLITATNQSVDSDFIITINPLGMNQPIADYPSINSNATAGTWNTAAFKNRRVEFQLIEAL